MRVIWNDAEPPQPINVADNPGDYVVQLLDRNGNRVTVKKTTVNSVYEVFITANGKFNQGSSKPVMVGKYAISVMSYENDSIPSHYVSILKSEVKGKDILITVDLCLPKTP